MTKRDTPVTRRGFLKTLAAGSAAAALPSVIPSSARGADGTVAPSNRIIMCLIGCGGMGSGDMRGLMGSPGVQFLAVCDVHKGRRERAKGTVNKRNGTQDGKAYLDYREMLARGDLDAAVLGLPDHWHAVPAIAAAKAGLDMYGEKPLARSIREARAMANAVHRYKRVWQTGSQQRSDFRFRRACELVRNGRIGTVKYAEVGLPGGGSIGALPAVDPPPDLDWDFWLGPAPYRPFRKFGRGDVEFNWRWIMDYSGGQLTDWAGHHIDIAHWGLGLERSGPLEIAGKGTYPDGAGYSDVPTSYNFTAKYAGGIEINIGSNNRMGAKWVGDKGWIHVTRGRWSASDPKILEEDIGPGEIHLYNSRNHRQNFVDCIRSREETVAPIEIGLRSISAGLLGEVAMLTGRKIKWDPVKEEIIGDAGASALLGRSYREPWTL